MFQTKVSVFEKAVILDQPIFLSVEALTIRQGQLHFLKWNHVFFFDHIITDFETNLATQSMKIVEKSKYIGIITFKGSTNLGLGLPTEDARSDDPRLLSTC